MQSLALDPQTEFDLDRNCSAQAPTEIIRELPQYSDRDLFSEISNSELEIWARQSMASNGFGDY